MANVLVFDTNQERLRLARGILGHNTIAVDSYSVALRIARDEPTHLVLADWTDSGGQRLVQEVNDGLPIEKRQICLLARDSIRHDPAGIVKLKKYADSIGAAGIVLRPKNKQRCFHRINATINRALFLGWLMRTGGTSFFPFDERTILPNCYTKPYTHGPFAFIVELFGGWEAFRDSADWTLLRSHEGQLGDIRELVSYWGELVQELSPHYLPLFISIHDAHGFGLENPATEIIHQLAEAICPGELIAPN